MLRPLSNKEMKEKECYWWCKEYRHGEGVGDNFCSIDKKDCPKKKHKEVNRRKTNELDDSD